MTARAKGATDGDAGAADEPTPEGGGPLPLDEIARRVGGRVSGDGAFRARDLRPVEEAGRDDLALLSSRRYLPYVGESTAGAWLVTEELEGALADDDRPRVVVADAAPAVAALLAHFHPPVALPASIHPTAVLGPGVRLGPGVSVGAHTVLEAGVSIGEGTRLEAHVVLGREVSIGAGCHIHPHVVVYPRTSLGDRVVVHAGACLGADGFGYTTVDGGHVKIPQAGALTIGHDVEIGANTTIDRGSIGDTRIGDGVKIDNLVHLAHNVRVGAGTLIAGMVGVAGSTRIGRGVWLGGQAGAIGHLDIGDGARIAVASRVMRDVRSGETVSGDPARPHREDLRRQAHLGRIPRLLARIEALEARLDGEGGAHPGREGADTQALERRVAELEARVQGPERPPGGGPTTP